MDPAELLEIMIFEKVRSGRGGASQIRAAPNLPVSVFRESPATNPSRIIILGSPPPPPVEKGGEGFPMGKGDGFPEMQ